MDPLEITREHRRRQALEGLEFEREREQALAEQLREIVAAEHGPAVDEDAFAKMEAEDVEVIREALLLPADEDVQEDDLEQAFAFDEAGEDDDDAGPDDEFERLEAEITDCRRRQRAFERYLDALDG